MGSSGVGCGKGIVPYSRHNLPHPVWPKCGWLWHHNLLQFNHKTCYLSGGFVVQVWWVCGPTLWWGCGSCVGLCPTTPALHIGYTYPRPPLMQCPQCGAACTCSLTKEFLYLFRVRFPSDTGFLHRPYTRPTPTLTFLRTM